MSREVRLVVVMDPIESHQSREGQHPGNPAGGPGARLAALLRGARDLWLRDGVAWGRLAPLEVFDDPAHWFVRGAAQSAPDWASST